MSKLIAIFWDQDGVITAVDLPEGNTVEFDTYSTGRYSSVGRSVRDVPSMQPATSRSRCTLWGQWRACRLRRRTCRRCRKPRRVKSCRCEKCWRCTVTLRHARLATT